MKNKLLDLDCGPCVEEECLRRHGTGGSCDGSRGLEDDKFNRKPNSRHNARNIHAGFPNFPFDFFFGPWVFFIPEEKIVEKERKTRILINNLTKGIQVNISFRLVDFISSFMLTDL